MTQVTDFTSWFTDNYKPNRPMDSTHTPAAVGIVGMLGTFTLSDINALVGIGVGALSLLYLLIRILKECKTK